MVPPPPDHEPEASGRLHGDIISLHPYLGYVYNPAFSDKLFDKSVNDFGFYSSTLPTTPAYRSNDFVLCITGGSVAAHLVASSEEQMIARLEATEQLRNTNVRITTISQGGYKQPQQLLGVMYFLSRGADYDAVINIDGVNEAVWYVDNDVNNNIDPSYPYGWSWHARRDNEASRQIVKTLNKQAEIRAQTAGFLIQSHLYYTATGIAAANWVRLWTARRDTALQQQALKVAKRDNHASFSQTGVHDLNSGTAITNSVAGAVKLWQRSSLEMHNYLSGRKTLYIHILQPNQYWHSSLSRSVISGSHLRGESIYGSVLPKCIGPFREAGRALSSRGVPFYDMSAFFASYSQDVYVDDCCHFDKQANHDLANAVVDILLSHLGGENL